MEQFPLLEKIAESFEKQKNREEKKILGTAAGSVVGAVTLPLAADFLKMSFHPSKRAVSGLGLQRAIVLSGLGLGALTGYGLSK